MLHARAWTGDPARPRAEALAVAGGRLAAVGTDAEVRALVGPRTTVLDLRGAAVVPGLVDVHDHHALAGQAEPFELALPLGADPIFGRAVVGEEPFAAGAPTRTAHHRPDFAQVFLDGCPRRAPGPAWSPTCPTRCTGRVSRARRR